MPKVVGSMYGLSYPGPIGTPDGYMLSGRLAVASCG